MHSPAGDSDGRSTERLHAAYKAFILDPSLKSAVTVRGPAPPKLSPARRWVRKGRVCIRQVGRALGEILAQRRDNGLGFARHGLGALRFAVETDVGPDSFFKHRLYLRRNWIRRNQYIYHEEICELLVVLNAAVAMRDSLDLEDKRRFFRRAREGGLPVAPIWAEFENGSVVHHRRPEAYGDADLFSKFSDWWCGEGATAWTARPEGSYLSDLGARCESLSALHETLRALSFERPVILQPRISNHEDLRPLSGKGLSTVRVVTVRDPAGALRVGLACCKMPIGALVADNFAGGALAAKVDLESGRLGAAVRKYSRPGEGPLSAHPDTGAPIAGATLPFWRETKDLALLAHSQFGDMPSVGWDIAITDDGPIVIEGNTCWCVDLAQISHQTPLGETIIAEALDAHFARIWSPEGGAGEPRPTTKG